LSCVFYHDARQRQVFLSTSDSDFPRISFGPAGESGKKGIRSLCRAPSLGARQWLLFAVRFWPGARQTQVKFNFFCVFLEWKIQIFVSAIFKIRWSFTL
jgi:hypothetical protein